MITSSYRRSALKLIARVRMLSKRSESPLSNVVTIGMLAAIVGVAWTVTGFSRVGSVGAKDVPAAAATVAAPIVATPVNNPTGGRSTVLSRREPMVYVVANDDLFYHSPVHVMHDANRQAVTVSGAMARGLEPCPVCFKTPTR